MMSPLQLYQQVSSKCSEAVTLSYSTSFSSAIRLLHPSLRTPVFSIYGFVRLADEIVDSFHPFDKPHLLQRFREDTYYAIENGISLNPVLHSFQEVVNQYKIDHRLIDAFFHSMEMDLEMQEHTQEEISEYIYGSAEVVGLMCLYVFCDGNREQFAQLSPYAQALGAAFQKVNFLRDFKADYQLLNRTYFPGCCFSTFDEAAKADIVRNIESDFRVAYEGVLMLPIKARFGVYVAYRYYYSLFNKIKKLKAEHVLERRIRIPNFNKAVLVMNAKIAFQLNLIK